MGSFQRSAVSGQLLGFLVLTLGGALAVRAETGYEAWLRYAPLEKAGAQLYRSLPAAVVALDDSAVVNAAQDEMIRGMRGMIGRTLRVETAVPREPVIILGTFGVLKNAEASVLQATCRPMATG